MDSQTFGCQDAWFQEQTDTLSSKSRTGICVWYTSVWKGSSTQNASPFPCRLLCHVPFKWPSSSTGRSYRESLATVSQWGNGTLLTPFGWKAENNGKQEKTEIDGWWLMMVHVWPANFRRFQKRQEKPGAEGMKYVLIYVHLFLKRWIFFILFHMDWTWFAFNSHGTYSATETRTLLLGMM